ncbi:MAG: sulfotransferase [Pseudomonadota bacterium]
MHPLSGADLETLSRVFRRAGALSRPGQGLMIRAAALGRWPFSTLEKALLAPKLPAVQEMTPPIFILGHWRSGTTHLYNIMAKADFGYVPPLATGLPWDLMGIAKVLEPLLERALPKTRYIDNIPVLPDSPQEDEIALANMTPVSFYHGIYFPLDFDDYLREGVFFDGVSPEDVADWKATFVYLMRKLSLHQKGKQLLIKNPVYTARLALLREMFPGAKFIHIRRNAYDVFASMRNFYAKLLKQFALQPYEHLDIDAAILDVYARMMRQLDADAEGLPEDAFVELRYDALDADPLGTVQLIYERLGIEGYAEARPRFEAYLKTITNYEKNKFGYSDEAAAKVEGAWGEFLAKWGDQRPGPARAGPVRAG